MGDSILLDPYDAYQFQAKEKPLPALLESGEAALTVWKGMILPHLQMNETTRACSFLSIDGRCGIHDHRPGICRLFPLGRYYENDTFHYILQTNECKKENRTKVKIKQFLGIPNLKEYEAYINDWHFFIKEMEKTILPMLADGHDEQAKAISMNLLQTFFIQPYDLEHFFEQYYERKKCVSI